MTGKTIHVPTKVWNHVIKACILFSVCLLIGFIISFFSPYVTLTMDPEERLAFWIILCLVGGLGVFTSNFIMTFLTIQLPKYIKVFFQTLGGTTAVLIPLYILYEPSEIPTFRTTFLFVWFIMVLIVAGTALILNLNTPHPETNVYPSQEGSLKMTNVHNVETPAKILKRLPLHLQHSELYALSAEDHYVRVHTSKGDSIILMRLSDAITETGGFQGLQTHRSWWVAKAAIDNIALKGRTAEIILKNNIEAPVSRNALKILRNAGWL